MVSEIKDRIPRWSNFLPKPGSLYTVTDLGPDGSPPGSPEDENHLTRYVDLAKESDGIWITSNSINDVDKFKDAVKNETDRTKKAYFRCKRTKVSPHQSHSSRQKTFSSKLTSHNVAELVKGILYPAEFNSLQMGFEVILDVPEPCFLNL